MTNNLKPVFLKPNKERAVMNRHPWVFSGAIAKMDSNIKVGDAVSLMDHRGQALAVGHWCADDGLVIRLLSFDPQTRLDDAFFMDRFTRAHRLRVLLGLPNGETNGYRLIHGEGDGLPGLVCDIYADVASIQLSNPGLAEAKEKLCQFLTTKCNVSHVFFADSLEPAGHFLAGERGEVSFLENGLPFFTSVTEGQKTGHFLDQRDHRALVRKYSQGRNVLDTFCYSGGFSVYALKGGASSVTSVDISKSAIALCEKNIDANQVKHAHSAVVADCFNYLRQINSDEFDLIILDPPAFAKSASAVQRASRGYKDINLLAMKAIKAGGLIFTFSCSQHIDTDLFKKIIFAAAKDSSRDVKILHELGQGLDHPTSVYCPQSSYLKGLVLYIE